MLILVLPISTLICLIYGIVKLLKLKVDVPPFIMMISTGFVFSLVEAYIIYRFHGLDNAYVISKLVFIIVLMFLNGLNTILKSILIEKGVSNHNLELVIKNNFLVDLLLIISIVLTIITLR